MIKRYFSISQLYAYAYADYENALQVTGLKTLHTRREERCLKYGLKAIKHNLLRDMFPVKSVENNPNLRGHEAYHVNFAHTEAYKQSAIPTIQRMLNKHAERAQV